MIDIILWLLVTIVIGTVDCLLGKRYGVEYLIGMFVGSIVVANTVASKLIAVGPFVTSAGLVVYSINFFLTDVLRFVMVRVSLLF